MSEFKVFRQRSNGAIVTYPADYADHPVFGYDLEPYDPETGEYEEDKVVSEDHNIPLDQRITITATPVEDSVANDEDNN